MTAVQKLFLEANGGAFAAVEVVTWGRVHLDVGPLICAVTAEWERCIASHPHGGSRAIPTMRHSGLRARLRLGDFVTERMASAHFRSGGGAAESFFGIGLHTILIFGGNLTNEKNKQYCNFLPKVIDNYCF